VGVELSDRRVCSDVDMHLKQGNLLPWFTFWWSGSHLVRTCRHFRESGTSFTYFRSTFVISTVFNVVTALVLAEICSAIPISGSIYIWAAASAGPKYARFVGFLVAWWSSVGWMTAVAGVCQVRPRLVITHHALR
jgi:amino acid transporter